MVQPVSVLQVCFTMLSVTHAYPVAISSQAVHFAQIQQFQLNHTAQFAIQDPI